MQNFFFSNCLVGGPANNSLAVRTSKEISSSPNKEPAERLSQETRERLEVKMERIGRLVSKSKVCRPGMYSPESREWVLQNFQDFNRFIEKKGKNKEQYFVKDCLHSKINQGLRGISRSQGPSDRYLFEGNW